MKTDVDVTCTLRESVHTKKIRRIVNGDKVSQEVNVREIRMDYRWSEANPDLSIADEDGDFDEDHPSSANCRISIAVKSDTTREQAYAQVQKQIDSLRITMLAEIDRQLTR